MASYQELVKRARELHAQLGEGEFRRRYAENPAGLANDLGVRSLKSAAAAAKGRRVLQAFPFYPLKPGARALYGKILEEYGKRPLLLSALVSEGGDSANAFTFLHVLEARGLVKVAYASTGKRNLIVTEVLDRGKWKKAMLPQGVLPAPRIPKVHALLDALREGRMTKREFREAVNRAKEMRRGRRLT